MLYGAKTPYPLQRIPVDINFEPGKSDAKEVGETFLERIVFIPVVNKTRILQRHCGLREEV